MGESSDRAAYFQELEGLRDHALLTDSPFVEERRGRSLSYLYLLPKISRSLHWSAAVETDADYVNLFSASAQIGRRALRQSDFTLLTLREEDTPFATEYEIDFYHQKIKVIKGVLARGFKERIGEVRAGFAERKLGINVVTEEDEKLIMTEMQRGASGDFVLSTSRKRQP